MLELLEFVVLGTPWEGITETRTRGTATIVGVDIGRIKVGDRRGAAEGSGIEDAITHTEDGVRSECIRQANPGRKFMRIIIDGVSRAACSRADKPHRARVIQASSRQNRVIQCWVEVIEPVMPFRGGLGIFPTETQVKSELRHHMPMIVYKRGIVSRHRSRMNDFFNA